MTDTPFSRSELLFIYDATDCNPNGDPLDGNKPRIDEDNGFNLVTDVRLKRTIRDYLFNYKGFNGTGDKDIFVRDTFVTKKDKQTLADGKTRAKDFGENKDNVCEKCVDIRLFGGVIPLSKRSITLTGPVQFKLGRSLHVVSTKTIQGTGAFASAAGKTQKTFREEHIVHYSLIGFHGIINQIAAQHSGMTSDDVQLLLEGMWFGTKNLISRSKFGQQPRLLIKINYKTSYFFIGDLDRKVSIESALRDEAIRSPKDFSLNMDALLEAIQKHAKHIESVEFQMDSSLGVTIPKTWTPLNLE